MELYAIERDYLAKYLYTVENATPEDRTMALEQFGETGLPDILTRDESDTASITITGPLSPEGPSPIARFFGFNGTSYNDVAEAAEALRNDPTIKNVKLLMDTPGGTVAGIDTARSALATLAKEKNVVAENHGMIASAGYYLASAADTITAMTPFAKTGSIGVVVARIDVSEAMARNGIKRIKIVSKNAPNKQPDPTTERGLGVIQDEIDATERVFIKTVAEGRGTTVDDVIENFGKGGLLIAEDPEEGKPDAISVGMIDGMANSSTPEMVDEDDGVIAKDNILRYNSEETDPTSGEGDFALNHEPVEDRPNEKETFMDLKTLKAEHPAVFEEAVSVGVNQEKERVDAHLTMGKASNDMDLAVACISDGSDFSPSVNAKYMAAGMKNQNIEARTDESETPIDTPKVEGGGVEEEARDNAVAEALGVSNG